MKYLIISILLFVTSICNSQITEWEKSGLDDSPKLNDVESKYFNEVFEHKKGEFDFTNSYVAFYTGSSGTTKSKKSSYFYNLQNSNNGGSDNMHLWMAGGTQILILDKKEKEKSGGYDVILVSWSKLLKQKKSRKRLIKRLNLQKDLDKN